MVNSTSRLLLVTSQEMIFNSLSLFTEVYPEFELVGSAATLQEALRLSTEQRPDLFLVDYPIRSIDPGTLVQTIRREFPAIPVIIMFSFVDRKITETMLATGASACLDKTTVNIDKLAETIRAVLLNMVLCTTRVG